ncbi:hypothetical protein BpHYR1_049385 [Brachionus plicatilis]|uniref:Uncharacterized protein n=1 Tax=Brachionus plicatilis TaxID=10195 RepID=A0A3M7RDI9_BRAPC|nr:hypothetical protein BpHYR1_049385 [Brachionus plicatilis]
MVFGWLPLPLPLPVPLPVPLPLPLLLLLALTETDAHVDAESISGKTIFFRQIVSSSFHSEPPLDSHSHCKSTCVGTCNCQRKNSIQIHVTAFVIVCVIVCVIAWRPFHKLVLLSSLDLTRPKSDNAIGAGRREQVGNFVLTKHGTRGEISCGRRCTAHVNIVGQIKLLLANSCAFNC